MTFRVISEAHIALMNRPKDTVLPGKHPKILSG